MAARNLKVEFGDFDQSTFDEDGAVLSVVVRAAQWIVKC